MAGLKLPSRKKQTVPTDTTVVEERPGAKNKPTPKRSQAVKARPVTPYLEGTGRSGGSRREVAKGDRDRRRGSLDAQRAAMKGDGDPARLPVRDRRPEAGFVRNYVDNRRNLVTLILLAYALLALNIVLKGQTLIITLLLAIVFLAAVDAVVLAITVKVKVKREFPGTTAKRLGWYAVQRATLPRRFRMPRQGVGIAPRR